MQDVEQKYGPADDWPFSGKLEPCGRRCATCGAVGWCYRCCPNCNANLRVDKQTRLKGVQ